MLGSKVAAFSRRVINRVALAWEESRVAAPDVPRDPRTADAGETLFVPARLSSRLDAFPETVRFPTVAALERRLEASAESIRLATGGWIPTDEQSLPRCIAYAADLARALEPGERIYWVQPLSNNFVLSVDEVEQIVGLAGPVDFVEETRTRRGDRCIIAAATVRRSLCAVAILWPASLLADREALATALRRLDRMPGGVRGGLHVIDVPLDGVEQWSTGARPLMDAVGEYSGSLFGVHLGSGAMARPLSNLVADRADLQRRIVVQWLDRGDDLSAPAPAAGSIRFDCSLAIDSDGSATPYVTHGPYVPLTFDARVSATGTERGALIEIPRIDSRSVHAPVTRWTSVTTSPERRAEADLTRLLDSPIAQIAARLEIALDLQLRREYLDRLESDRSLVTEWHRFHVYNWPAPPCDVLRLVTYDAGDLLDAGSPLSALTEVRRVSFVTGATMTREAAAMAHVRSGSAARIREDQIAAHGYLADGGRSALTADSETLIAALPEAPGSTLEIGFGYALTARRLSARASRYVGIELRAEQASALREAGGLGLVADITALPLADGAFDTVIADNVLEHAASPLSALREARRVLRRGGRLYALIPLDAETNEFQIRTHLWKADEASIRRAAELAGFRIVDLRVLSYGALGVYGCFPASRGRTCLVIFESISAAQRIAV